MEGALKDAVEAGFITMEERQLWGGVLGGEGVGDAMDLVAGRLAAKTGIEDAGFHGPGAAHAPEGGDHFFHHAEFDGVEGAEAGKVVGKEILKCFRGLVFEQDAAGEEAVTDSVLGRAALPFARFRSGGSGAIGARRKDTPERGHGNQFSAISLLSSETARLGQIGDRIAAGPVHNVPREGWGEGRKGQDINKIGRVNGSGGGAWKARSRVGDGRLRAVCGTSGGVTESYRRRRRRR